MPPPPADGPVVPVPNHYTSLSWLSCFICLPLGIFAVDESQRAQALSKEERHAEAAQAARWSAKLAYVALGMAAIFYPLFLWGGAGPAADATAQTCAPPIDVSNHYDLTSVAVKFTGTHYDDEPTGAPLMVEVSGVVCKDAASQSASPVVNVCVMHNVPATGPSKTGPQYTCRPSSAGKPVPMSVKVDGVTLAATDCWYEVSGCD